MPKIRRPASCPPIGTLEYLRLPEDVRVDTGVREGDTVTPFYDPMIAKVIAHGATRTEAAHRLAKALEQVGIAGLKTNNAFLIRALASRDFLDGEVDTGFIERHLAELVPPAAPSPHIPRRRRRLPRERGGAARG